MSIRTEVDPQGKYRADVPVEVIAALQERALDAAIALLETPSSDDTAYKAASEALYEAVENLRAIRS